MEVGAPALTDHIESIPRKNANGFVFRGVIDGVLADVRHRLHYLATRPKNWDGFFAAAKNDQVLEVGAEFAKRAAATHEIVYLTGRPERLRTATQSWLDEQQLPAGRLVMRPEGDRRPSAVVKLHELRRLRRESKVEMLVDDDPSVVEAARAGSAFPVSSNCGCSVARRF